MLIPGKYLREDQSLLYLGGLVLAELDGRRSLSLVWERVGPKVPQFSFDNFILALDFLFAVELVTLNEYGILVRLRTA